MSPLGDCTADSYSLWRSSPVPLAASGACTSTYCSLARTPRNACPALLGDGAGERLAFNFLPMLCAHCPQLSDGRGCV